MYGSCRQRFATEAPKEMRLFAFLLAALFVFATSASRAERVSVFFDTDIETDCDDAAALAVLHALADNGECDILATVVSVRDWASVATVAAINNYYGRDSLPLGMVKGNGVLENSKFAFAVAREFPTRVKSDADVPDATLVYRDVLEKQPDQLVTIVTVGYLTNLKNLLQLQGDGTHPSGLDLIKAKVKNWVCMGGNFVGDPPKDDLKLGNVNFQRDAASAYYVVHHWPTPMVFVGREIGSIPSGLEIGDRLVETPAHNPVRAVYSHYFGGTVKKRHVADPTTVLYAIRGLRDYWDIQTKGWMDLREDMTFEWKSDRDARQAYLLKKRKESVSNDRMIESVLDALLVQAPRVKDSPKR
jgi:inosine-uridine nucleoside N-ribohydrolase